MDQRPSINLQIARKQFERIVTGVFIMIQEIPKDYPTGTREVALRTLTNAVESLESAERRG